MGNQNSSRDVETPLSPRELSAFFAQLAMLVRSGIPAAEAISIMRGDAGGGPGGELLAAIGARLEDRAALGTALAETGVFPRYFVSMVEIGETSGRLDEVLDALCAYYEREESVSEGIRSAVAYPLVMIVMMALVVGVLVIKVLPVFSEVFVELGGGASSFAGQVMRLGAAAGRIAIALTAAVLLLLAAYLLMRAFPAGRAALSRWSAVFPLTRGLSARVASGRFASAMAMMLSSGLDSDQSLDLAVRLLDEGPTRRRAERCRELVADGASFADAVSQAGIFPGVYARMVSVGFSTGSADTVLRKLASRYEEEVDARVARMLSVLEPTLVAILAVVVGAILLSVMLPLMGVMSSIG